ncbi:uncharacterized protein LOC122257471 [Penaeus japonicus]|uniref:uncharacterized protein LOC122257471 n=1 Tax=Penaeus japonicus TaxID=27405 RepID=UPI001C70EA50|nr:uncharacterized protein LOC122257471 [Penaeus japonicus]
MLHCKATVKTGAPLVAVCRTRQTTRSKTTKSISMVSLDRKTKIRVVALVSMFIYLIVLIIVVAGTILLALENAIGAIITFTSLGLMSFGLVAALQWFLSSLKSGNSDPPPPYRVSWWLQYRRRSAASTQIEMSTLHERSALAPGTPSAVSLSSAGVGARGGEVDGGGGTDDGRVFVSVPEVEEEDPPTYEEAMRACATEAL